MKYSEALKAIASPDHAGSRVRRAAWPAGDHLRRATPEEHAIGPYVVEHAGKKPHDATLAPADTSADDWSVVGPAPEPKPSTPPAPLPHDTHPEELKGQRHR